jgi:hypothetical protein
VVREKLVLRTQKSISIGRNKGLKAIVGKARNEVCLCEFCNVCLTLSEVRVFKLLCTI